ncbi:MAG TPA: response regulator [Magnetospirillum sp.]|nr:response regulator [Magnetospirillum sp.]
MTQEPPFHILLAEDLPADAGLVRAALQDGRFYCSLDVVEDGEQVLAYLRGQVPGARRPDLVLLDLNLPRMNGREVLRAMKDDADLRLIPVVVLTTSDVERDIEASYSLGAVGFVTKPLEVNEFFQAIHAIENYWFTVVRLPHGTRTG